MKTLLALLIILPLIGCGREINYDRVVTKDGNVIEKTKIRYRGPWGSSEMKDLEIKTDEGKSMKVGGSSVDMDQFWKSMETIMPELAGDLKSLLVLMLATAEANYEAAEANYEAAIQ